MFDQTHWLQRPEGRTAFHYLPATGTARGILLIAHGLAEHSKRYAAFADYMSSRGYHVYAFDHRGHGETKAPDAPLGQFARKDGFKVVIDDVAAMRTHAAEANPYLRIVLFGQSMGGLITMNCAVSHPGHYDAIAIFNSNLRLGIAGTGAKALLWMERALKGSDVPSALLPKLTFSAWGRSIKGHRTDFDWLSRDESEVDRYISDPLCGFDASVSMWLDIVEMSSRPLRQQSLAALAKDKPIYLVGGGADPATDHAKAITSLADYLRGRGFSKVTTRIYEDMRHETLKEFGREGAMAEFADWCDTSLKS